MVSRVPIDTRKIYLLRHGKWSVCDDPRGSFVYKGDAEVMISAVTSISIIRYDIIVHAAAVGPY
jgi:hypothetical protein